MLRPKGSGTDPSTIAERLVPTDIQAIRQRLRFLKGPACVVLILAGFILEFIVELPFRIVTLAVGKRP